MSSDNEKQALIIGASRGLGYALTEEFLSRGWQVTATERKPSALRELGAASAGRLQVETLDMTDPAQVSALGERLAGSEFDLLFINAGVNCPADTSLPAAQVSTEDFITVMVTNALSPMRVIETLATLVPAGGTIGVMSSGLASVGNNVHGGFEVYRASKTALNQLMCSFAARHANDPRTLLLIDPGWVQTEMGGPNASLSIQESIPAVADTIEAQAGRGGLHFLDRHARTINW